MKLKRFGALAAALALTLSLTGVPARAATFSDTENHWSVEYVEDLYGKGIIKGYDDGKFYPERTMSAAEALLFCTRITGVDGDIQDMIFEKRGEAVKAVIPQSIVSWASQELSVAVETGIVSLEELEALNQVAPSSLNYSGGPQPALVWNISREDVCMYLVRAMQLEPLALSFGADFCEAYLKSHFIDADKIAPTLRPYIYVLHNYGVFTGMESKEGTQANPKGSLKRGEMMALISRGLKVMKEMGLQAELEEYTTYPWAAGSITKSVSDLDGTIHLTLAGEVNSPKTYELPATVKIYDEYNRLGRVGDLANGHYVRLAFNEEGTVETARLCGKLTAVEGMVVSVDEREISLWVEGSSRVYELSRFTQVLAGGVAGDLNVIEEEAGYTHAVCYLDSRGRLAELKLSGGTSQVSGLLQSVTTNNLGVTTIGVADFTGVVTSYVVAADAKIQVNQAAGELKAEQVSRPVVLRVDEETGHVTAMEVDTLTLYVQGPIRNQTSVASTRTLTIANSLDGGREVKAALDPEAVITYNGEERTLVETGWFATAKLVSGVITELTAYPASSTVEGILSAIDYDTASTTLHLEKTDGGELTYSLDMNALPTVTRNGKNSTVSQLRKGDVLVVTLRYHSVEKIEATPREADLKGTIEEITKGAAGTTVRVKLEDGTEGIYQAGSNVAVTQNGKAITFNDLNPGDQVAMIVNGDNLLSVEILAAVSQNNQITGKVFDIVNVGNTRTLSLLVEGFAEPVTVDLRAKAAAIQDVNGRSLSLLSGGLATGHTVTVFGSWNGAIFEATMVIRLST